MQDAIGWVRAALLAHGHADTITQFPDGHVIASGANRVDKRLAGEAAGPNMTPADPGFVLAQRKVAAGGVSQVGVTSAPALRVRDDGAGTRI